VTRMSATDRREALVAAAIRVMTRDGVAKATTRAIAAEAGMPLGIFHYAFHSKQELMVRVTERITEPSWGDIDAAIAGQDGELDALAVTRAALQAYLEHVIAHPKEHLVSYELTTSALRDAELEEVARAQYDHYQRLNENMFEAAAEVFGVEYAVPVPVLARYAISLMDGLGLNYLARGDADEARAVVELAAATIVGMVRPRQEAPVAADGSA
jgi:AcrR family transcriptional regulator